MALEPAAEVLDRLVAAGSQTREGIGLAVRGRKR
jgi:hypothetical protein